MFEKILSGIVQTPDQKYQKYIQEFREQNVPLRYNQIELLNHLNNPEIDHYISISNRTDGKSINYIHALLNIAIDYDIGLSFFSRNMMLRLSYQTLIEEIIELSTIFERKDFTFIRQQYYITLNYKDKTIAVISDLNNATELKYFSNYMKKFPILIYDEFLALETDYLPDEWERLKTIYESIDREEFYPLIGKPKIIYLGNAVNFSSPILAGLKIFRILENHPIDTCKIYKYTFNVALELHKNEQANDQRNTRAFGSENDSMTTGQFKVNSYNLATDNDRNAIKQNPCKIIIKLKADFLKITFNRDTYLTLLSIENNIGEEDYSYNLQLKDKKETSIFLNDRYFDDNHIKKIDKGGYLFDNNFSKDYITNDFHELNTLKINKLIREVLQKETKNTIIESKEQQFKDNYIEQSKKGLMKKFNR